MKALKQLKDDYENINIPNDYDLFIDESIAKAQKQSFFTRARIIKLSIASSFCLYVLCLNTIPAFAHTMMQIPIISDISKVLCIHEFSEVSETKDIHIKVPEITNTGNSQLEKRVNKEINDRIDQIVNETREQAAFLEKEHLKVYRDSEVFVPANVNIDYQVYYQSDRILSFVISKSVIQANNYTEDFVYNLDLKSGKEITLASLFEDEHYKEKINEQIHKQINERIHNDENAYFYDGDNKFTSIHDHQKFYINKDGYIVILFDKYEIAPGYMGNLSFPLDISIQNH